MNYMQQLQSSLRYVVAAGQAGRRSADEMLAPMNGAVSDITGAVAELEGLPFVGPLIGVKLQRTMRAIHSAQATVNQVSARYDQALAVVVQVQDRVQAFGEQVDKAAAKINQIAGKISPSLGNILPTGNFLPAVTPVAEAVKPFPHLLILQPLDGVSPGYYFNLDTAAFEELRRQTSFRWSGQERLSRSVAQQAVSLGEEKINIRGTIFPTLKGGLGQLQTLRSIGRLLRPLSLISGYGEVLGNWCLTNIDEDQSNLLAGGIPRKQAFTLEFVSYGDDLQNL
ncbi:phage tail protein [Pseudomonas putida]|uniref:phage tail protein n=1 Tax=Pseudomonas putida TaxID=303 RepID=UPI0023653C09|nr:phage tail protein [Pseudomonas putida]MDD2047325.1 phage tail protein [Pseudomonas putida]